MTETKVVGLASILKVVGAIAIVIFLIIALRNGLSNNTAVNDDNVIQQEGLQIINLGFKNGNYYPNTIEVEAGKPVKIIANLKEITGCYRAILIPNMKINKYLRAGDNIIEFTPMQKGKFGFSCAMGMGTGQIIVK